MAPFLQDFYGSTNLTTQKLNPEAIETPLLAAIAAQPSNAEARIELARFTRLPLTQIRNSSPNSHGR